MNNYKAYKQVLSPFQIKMERRHWIALIQWRRSRFICQKVKIRFFPMQTHPAAPTWEIILSLYGKAGTGGFFARFEP